MCLLSKSNKTYVAKKPITCYKIVRWNLFLGFFSSIQNCEIPGDIIFGSRNYVAEGTESICPIENCYTSKHKNWLDQKYCTEGGFIHCILTEEDARKYCNYFNNYEGRFEIRLFKVEVPANTKYIKGVNGFSFEDNHPINGLKVIAAKEVKFIEEIKL